jgi:hypothetical protein
MVRSTRAIAALLVAFGVFTSTCATCVEAATSTPSRQMACCKAGHDRCPMKHSASDCCKQSGPRNDVQATIVKVASASGTVSVPVLWVTVPALSLNAQIQPRVSYPAAPPDLLDAPPPYIAFSGLLI